MAKNDEENNLFMIIFMVTASDVLTWANECGIPLSQVTDDVIGLLKENVRQSADSWRSLFEEMVKQAIKCPLDIACSPSCPWQEIGECILPTALK